MLASDALRLNWVPGYPQQVDVTHHESFQKNGTWPVAVIIDLSLLNSESLPNGESMHTFQFAKESFVVEDTDLTDKEIELALGVGTLLRKRMTKTFWDYMRTLSIVFLVKSADEKLLMVRLGLLIPQVGNVVDMELSVFLIDDPYVAEVMTATIQYYPTLKTCCVYTHARLFMARQHCAKQRVLSANDRRGAHSAPPQDRHPADSCGWRGVSM